MSVKLYVSLCRGKSGLEPILGRHSVVTTDQDDEQQSKKPPLPESAVVDAKSRKARDFNADRVCSYRLPSADFGDIKYLRNRMGYTLPTEEQVLQTYKLKKNVPSQRHFVKGSMGKQSLPTLTTTEQIKQTVEKDSRPTTVASRLQEMRQQDQIARERKDERNKMALNKKMDYLMRKRVKLLRSMMKIDKEQEEYLKGNEKTDARTDELLSRLTRIDLQNAKVANVCQMRKYSILRDEHIKEESQKDVEKTKGILDKIKQDRELTLLAQIKQREKQRRQSEGTGNRNESLDIFVSAGQLRGMTRRKAQPVVSESHKKVDKFLRATRFI